MNFSSGLSLSDEKYAKTVTLPHGAGLPDDIYSAAYSHHVPALQGDHRDAPLADVAQQNLALAEGAAELGGGANSGLGFEAGDQLEVGQSQVAAAYDGGVDDVPRTPCPQNDVHNSMGGSLSGAGARKDPSDEDQPFCEAP